MKLKREVERLTALCNGMNSTKETVINKIEMGEKNKSTNIIEENKKIDSKDKNIPKLHNKKIKKSGEQSEKEIQTKMYKCNECEYVCEKETGLEYHMLKNHEAENYLKCDECNFSCAGLITLRKHGNTRHFHAVNPMYEAINKSLQNSNNKNNYKPVDS